MTALEDIPAGRTAETTGDALRPVTPAEKSWGWFAVFNIWANDIQSLFGYSLVASLFISYGVSGWTAFSASAINLAVKGSPQADFFEKSKDGALRPRNATLN